MKGLVSSIKDEAHVCVSIDVMRLGMGFKLVQNNTGIGHTDDIIWTSLCMELISKIPSKSLTLLCVAAITLLI